MLTIDERVKELIIEDAITTFPDECCGFLFGYEDGDQRYITEAQPVNNAKEGDKRRRFEIAPFDYLQAERYALDNDLLLLGIYHSHPNHPAIASETDRLAAQPYFSYVIISVQQGKFADLLSWRLNEQQQFDAETIHQHKPVV
jgi:proteasome lid subunit RPN8/RPN11